MNLLKKNLCVLALVINIARLLVHFITGFPTFVFENLTTVSFENLLEIECLHKKIM